MQEVRSCPVCGCSKFGRIFIDENIDKSKISGLTFASRKQPEFMCHRLVQCFECDLVYANNPPSASDLADAYHSAEYDSALEANDAAFSYIQAIRPLLKNMKSKDKALEIGAGTGIFLDYLAEEGFAELVGVEPSSAAIAAAPEKRKGWIKEGIFNENDFIPNTFDLICCFMTLEHVHDPNVLMKSVFNLLKPGGVFVVITHDYRSLVNRILGKKSPIVDIEHMQLFSKKSIFNLFCRCNFIDVSVASFSNSYRISYWLKLAPIPNFFRNCMFWLINLFGLSKLKFTFNVGNIVTYGFKPKA